MTMKGHAMNGYTVSFHSTCLSVAFALFALPAAAAWTVTTSGTSPVVTDGDWSLTVNNGTSLSVSTTGSSTLLDMSTLCEDTGLSPTTCNNDFLRSNASIEEVRLPTSLESLSKQCFQYCSALTTVELGPAFQGFASTHAFSQCYSLTTIYTRGEPKVEGLVKLPDIVTSIPGFTFEMPYNHNNTTVRQILARGVTSVDTAAFYRMENVTNIVLSSELYSVTSSNDNGPFYMCKSLATLFPSNLNLTAAVGQSAFREIPLDHDLDFSGSTFTTVGVNSFFGIKLKDGCRITMPATLNTIQNQAFKQYQNNRSPNIVRIRFLGEVPAFSGTYNLSPYNTSKHNVLYVDAKKCPSWTASGSGFTSVEDDPTLLNQASYPGPKTLGKSTLGVTETDRWNWLVQENLPKGPTYWEVVGTDGAGVVTISSTNGYWTLSLTPNGAGGYMARCLSATAPTAEPLDLGKIEDDTDLPLAGLAEGAFSDCQKLSGITIPAGADALGAHAFSNCTALAKVVLPATFSWDSAGVGAFEGCSALTELGLSSQNVVANKLVLPAAATTLADALFAGCTQFTSFAGPGVTSLGARVFDGCSALATATFAGDLCALAALGEADFRGTALTQTMDFTSLSITAIPASLFENCTGVSLVKLPASVTSVGAAAFKNIAPGASVSFAGNPPTFGDAALQPSANAAGSRYIVRVEDGDLLSAWKASGFTPTTSEMQSETDYLGNIYQGWTTLGAAGYSNWLFFLDPTLTWWISGKSTYKRPDNNVTYQTTVVTDGDWEMHVFVENNVTNLAPKLCVAGGTLDMTTLNTDTGLTPSVVDYKAFFGLAAGAGPAVVRLPDSITTLGGRCFQENRTIVEVEAGAGFASMGSTSPFREANAFATFYKRGDAERVEGRIEIPEIVTSLPESCFFNCDGVQEVLAPSVVSLGNSCFYHDGALTNAVFSPDLHTVAGGGSGVFYQCGHLRTISPSKMNLTSTGTDAFRELRLNHGLDFSGATFTSLPERTLYDIHCTGPDGKPRPITLPKTLQTVGKQALYGQAAWNQIYVFLGDKPTFGENALKPVQPGDAGKRFFIVADVARYPAWIAADFTSLEEEDKTLSDYPKTYLKGVPGYPGGKVLGWSTISSGGYKNWLIQFSSRGFMLFVR